MKGWLIYKHQDAIENRSYIDWFIEEAGYQGIHLELIYREQLTVGIIDNNLRIQYQQKPAEFPAFAVVRVIEPVLNMHLEACGIPVFNNKEISFIANDKIRTHHEVQQLGIPMVDTIYMKYSTAPINPPFPFPFIMKAANGRGGKQVFLIKDQNQWEEKQIEQTKQGNSGLHDYLVQRCNVQTGKDIRVFVVGKEIIGAVKRTNKSDFRANYKLGGTVTWYALNKAEQKMIDSIIAHFEFGMVGIDFLVDEDGKLLFNEIEDVVGSRSLSKVSDINILKKYVTHIKKNVTNQHSIQK